MTDAYFYIIYPLKCFLMNFFNFFLIISLKKDEYLKGNIQYLKIQDDKILLFNLFLFL